MNRRDLRWLDLAIRLSEENQELRRIATTFLWWIYTHDDLAALARAQINARWPEDVR